VKGSITITRNSSDTIRVAIRDSASRTQFVTVEMSPHDFAMALTGLAEVEANVSVCGLANVGKFKVSEARQATYPGSCHDKKELERWLLEHCKEEGWIIDPYLGTKTSKSYNHAAGNTTLNYRVYKFVDATAEGGAK
jgi:hypothetical protein